MRPGAPRPGGHQVGERDLGGGVEADRGHRQAEVEHDDHGQGAGEGARQLAARVLEVADQVRARPPSRRRRTSARSRRCRPRSSRAARTASSARRSPCGSAATMATSSSAASTAASIELQARGRTQGGGCWRRSRPRSSPRRRSPPSHGRRRAARRRRSRRSCATAGAPTATPTGTTSRSRGRHARRTPSARRTPCRPRRDAGCRVRRTRPPSGTESSSRPTQASSDAGPAVRAASAGR